MDEREKPGVLVEMERVPLRPRNGSSTIHPASKAPGTPIADIMTCYERRATLQDEISLRNGRSTHVPVGDVDRTITKVGATGLKEVRDEGVVKREC